MSIPRTNTSIYYSISTMEQRKIIYQTSNISSPRYEKQFHNFISNELMFKFVSKKMILENKLSLTELQILKNLRDNLKVGLSEEANNYINEKLRNKIQITGRK